MTAPKGREFLSDPNSTDSLIQIWKARPGINKAQTRVNKTLTPQNLFRNFDISLLYWFVVHVVDASFDCTEGTRFCQGPNLHRLTHPN